MKIKIFKIRLSEDCIYQDQKILDTFLQENNILKYETAFVKEDESYWSVILYFEELIVQLNESKPGKYSADDEVLNVDEVKILDSLKLWRTEKAREQKLPVYFIATNKELFSIANTNPVKKKNCWISKVSGNIKSKIMAKK